MRTELIFQYMLKPMGDALYYFVNHPLNSLSNMLYSTGDFVVENPYTCVAIIGLGAYAIHKGIIKCNGRRAEVNHGLDTCIGGYQTNTRVWIGRR